MTINKVCPFVRLAVGPSSVCPLVKQNFKSRNRHFKRNKSDKRLAGSQHTPLLTHTLTPSDICKCETDKIDYNNKCRRSSVSLDYKKSKIKTKIWYLQRAQWVFGEGNGVKSRLTMTVFIINLGYVLLNTNTRDVSQLRCFFYFPSLEENITTNISPLSSIVIMQQIDKLQTYFES